MAKRAPRRSRRRGRRAAVPGSAGPPHARRSLAPMHTPRSWAGGRRAGRSPRLGPDRGASDEGSGRRITTGGLRWWTPATTAILATGILVTAAIALVSSLPTHPAEPPSGARFTAVRVMPGIPLSDYRQRSTALVPVERDGEGGAPPAVPPSPPVGALGDAPDGGAVPAAAAPGDPTAAGRPVRAPLRSRSASAATPPTPFGPGTTTGPASTHDVDIADGFTVPAGFEIDPVLLTDYTRQARGAAFAALGCRTDPGRCADRVTMDYLVTANALAPDGRVVPPDVAAQRVVTLLDTTRAGPTGAEPLGVVVATDVELSGLRGEPVLLTWAMWRSGEQARVHGDWLDDDLAYRLRATSDLDTVTLDLWIPLPPRPGAYVVRVALAGDGAALATAASAPFG